MQYPLQRTVGWELLGLATGLATRTVKYAVSVESPCIAAYGGFCWLEFKCNGFNEHNNVNKGFSKPKTKILPWDQIPVIYIAPH